MRYLKPREVCNFCVFNFISPRAYLNFIAAPSRELIPGLNKKRAQLNSEVHTVPAAESKGTSDVYGSIRSVSRLGRQPENFRSAHFPDGISVMCGEYVIGT